MIFLKKTKIYEIRLARKDEGEALILFLKKYWNSNHALVLSRELFDFQHLSSDYYNIIIGYNTITGEIDGLQALIPVAQYDTNLREQGIYWGAILRVRDDVDNPEIRKLVMYLVGCIFKLPDFKKLISMGMGPLGLATIRPWLKQNGVLNHYYIANNDIHDFKIGKNLATKDYPISNSYIKELDITTLSSLPYSTFKPQKTLTYLINRFYNHPLYKYTFWGVYNNDVLMAIFVIRRVDVENIGACIHIVDCIGDLNDVGNIGNSVVKFLKNNQLEYVDLVNYGISEEVFSRMGFELLNLEQDEVIVPNFFEPFERKNVVIRYAINPEPDFVIFKADADQDRPSII